MIRISQAGACPRRVWLEAQGVEGLPQAESTLRAFEEGHLHEPSILAWAANNLPNAPYTLSNQQLEVKATDFLVGHVDAIGLSSMGNKPVLLEAKCLKRRAFQEFRQNGVKESHPQYYTQVQLYLHGLKRAGWDIGQAYLVARNKETPPTQWWEHHYEYISYNPEFVRSKIQELEKLAEAIEQKKEVPPPYHPDRDWQCRYPWCVYTQHCWPGWKKQSYEVQDRSDLATVVEMYQEVCEEIKALEELKEELKAKLQEEAGETPIQAGRWLVQWIERRQERFDTKLARKELPAEVLAKLLKVSTYKVLEIKEAV